jgi:branched-chain amino acid transport system ATP-binding protein
MNIAVQAPVLEVTGLDSFYGQAHILFDLGLNVQRGEVVALLGRNGAGKSTTLKSIMGMVRPASGTIRFAGGDIAGMTPFRIARLGLGYVPEDRRIFTGLTVLENLEVGRQAPRDGAPSWSPERLFELFPALGEMRHRRGGQMSGGEQQMLTIARTLMGNPLCLLLDEPSEGLAPVIVDQMIDIVSELKAAGVAILLSEQNMRFAAAVADRACIIEKGRIRFEGPFAELAGREDVTARYLQV